MAHHRIVVVSAVVTLCVGQSAAGAQSASGPVARQPTTVRSYEKVLTGLIANGADVRLWNGLTPDARRELLKDVNKLQTDITIQKPIGPVPPRPPSPPKPQPKIEPTSAPQLGDFERSLAALKQTLQKTKATDATYVLPPAVDSNMQLLVQKLSNAKRE
jgi:hypothetical protein